MIRAVIFAHTREEVLEKFWKDREGHRLRIVRVESTMHWKHTGLKTWDIYYVRGEEDKGGRFHEVEQGYLGKCLYCGGNVLQRRGQGRPGKFCRPSHRKSYNRGSKYGRQGERTDLKGGD